MLGEKIHVGRVVLQSRLSYVLGVVATTAKLVIIRELVR
jgi:hypothetical protein